MMHQLSPLETAGRLELWLRIPVLRDPFFSVETFTWNETSEIRANVAPRIQENETVITYTVKTPIHADKLICKAPQGLSL